MKRPHFMPDNEEKLADAEESRGSHKIHHPPKSHASRHHKKHDKIAHTTTDRVASSTTESTMKISTTLGDDKVSMMERKFNKYSTTTTETSTAETVTETPITTIFTTVKAKKSSRRQKNKETSTNRTEIEEDKPQRRRKVHHHRRNNTLLTNSVHDNAPHVTLIMNATDSSDATSSTQDSTTHERYNQHKFTTAATNTIIEGSTTRQRIADVFRSTNDFNEDRTTESVVFTETTMAVTSSHMTKPPGTNSAISKDASVDRPRSMSTIPTTTTISPIKRYSKIQKNRTSGLLGPARIDVTILEAPDRKHKQGEILNKIFWILIYHF